MELKPAIGIDTITFGMTRKEVISILGEPDRVLPNDWSGSELKIEWNDKKLRLSFYQNENDRFGQLRTTNPNLEYKGYKIIGAELEFVKETIFGDLIPDWEIDDRSSCIECYNEKHWLTLWSSYGVVIDFETGFRGSLESL